MSGTLYVVATPLGNLEDLSPRAARVLREADLVAAEDTRRARVLLQHAAARPRVISYHAQSRPSQAARILATLARGESAALVTDAGTPTISDPGAALVARARREGHRVVAVPGPSAVAAALSIAGFPADRYAFLGFLPRKGRGRRALLDATAASPWTVVLFESAVRLVPLLEDLTHVAGSERMAAVTRELTKVHEDVHAGTLGDLAVYYREHEARGEVTVVVAGRPRASEHVAADPDAARERARALLAQGLSRRDAATRLAQELDVSRNDAYRVVTGL